MKNNSRFATLFKGELSRMNKYYIAQANIFAAVFWIAIIAIGSKEELIQTVPMVLVMDAAAMTLILVGALLFFEKKESTIKTMLISPISINEYLISKIISSILISLETLLIILASIHIFHNGLGDIAIIPLIMATILAVVFHSLLGFIISFKTKDFTGLLLGMMAYFVFSLIPTILLMSGVIPDKFNKIMLLLPTEATMTLFNSAFVNVDIFNTIFSFIYLLLVSGFMYFLVHKNFRKYALKEGV